MKKLVFFVFITFFLGTQVNAQLKFGTNGVGFILGNRNQINFRIHPSVTTAQLFDLAAEIQYNRAIIEEERNKFYIGIGYRFYTKGVQRSASGGFVNVVDANSIYIPVGIEYFPLHSKKVSFQLETGPAVAFEEGGGTIGYSLLYSPRGVFEINYFFKQPKH